MKVLYQIELFNDPVWRTIRAFDQAVGDRSECPPSPFIALLVSHCRRYEFVRNFLPAMRDYSSANSKGTRGIMLNYFLEDGEVYEIKEQISWKRWNHKFIVTTNGEITEIDKETVISLLNARLG